MNFIHNAYENYSAIMTSTSNLFFVISIIISYCYFSLNLVSLTITTMSKIKWEYIKVYQMESQRVH